MLTETQPINPWKEIWVRPRLAINEVLETDLIERTGFLAITFGTAYLLWLYPEPATNIDGLINKLAASAIIGCFLGALGVCLLGGSCGWLGRKLGGTATNEEVMAAIAWSGLPPLALLPLTILGLVFVSWRGGDSTNLYFALLNPLFVIAMLWQVGLTIIALSEAHYISIWRATITFFLPLIAWTVSFFTVFVLCMFIYVLRLSSNL